MDTQADARLTAQEDGVDLRPTTSKGNSEVHRRAQPSEAEAGSPPGVQETARGHKSGVAQVCSHQWLGLKVADPGQVHLRTMQRGQTHQPVVSLRAEHSDVFETRSVARGLKVYVVA